MFQKVYPVRHAPPLEELRRILADVRRAELNHTVTIGTPPFDRDWLNQIKAIRLRFQERTDSKS